MTRARHAHRSAIALALLAGCGGEAATSLDSRDAAAPSHDASFAVDASNADAEAGAIPPAAPRMGANVEAQGVAFRMWAPHATAVSVAGDFPGGTAPMQALGSGVFEAHVAGAHAGTTYRYVLESAGSSVDRVDPYCRELVNGGCIVVDPASYAWQAPPFVRPPRNGAVVYEMHVGSFAVDATAATGTLASARARLASLADLGVNVVELMPVHDFGGHNGWGYNPQLWLAPKPEYGTSRDLRAFVDEAHRLGIAVWIDVVMNHYDGWSGAPLFCFDGCPNGGAGDYFFAPGPYAKTPWGPRPDYTSAEVSAMLLASIDQFIVEYHGDGFRWDSTSNIRALDGAGTTPGGRELLVLANDRTHALGAMSVAEDLKGSDAITRATSSPGGFGFDAQWDGFGWAVTGVLVPASDAARDLGAIEGALRGSYAGDAFARVLWTENHDTVGNGGSRLPDRIDPADPTSWTARKRSMLGAVLLLTAPGVPMLFMGQESLATGTFASPPAPLAAPGVAGLALLGFYRDLVHLRPRRRRRRTSRRRRGDHPAKRSRQGHRLPPLRRVGRRRPRRGEPDEQSLHGV